MPPVTDRAAADRMLGVVTEVLKVLLSVKVLACAQRPLTSTV